MWMILKILIKISGSRGMKRPPLFYHPYDFVTSWDRFVGLSSIGRMDPRLQLDGLINLFIDQVLDCWTLAHGRIQL
jgi:hypothetical protein